MLITKREEKIEDMELGTIVSRTRELHMRRILTKDSPNNQRFIEFY